MPDRAELPVIWLQPDCDEGECGDLRCWAPDNVGPCAECGRPCVPYVLSAAAPLLPEMVAALRRSIARLEFCARQLGNDQDIVSAATEAERALLARYDAAIAVAPMTEWGDLT